VASSLIKKIRGCTSSDASLRRMELN
jgi:hypothetical protein